MSILLDACRCRFAGLAAMLLILVGGFSGKAAAAEPYRLGPMDTVLLRIAEWQTAEGTFRDWEAISGEYKIGPDGSLSVPFIGEVPASGKTTAEISATVSDALQRALGLTDRPHAAVEIAEFRPFFVAGHVQSPGAFPYAPDLTVLKATSLAGGARRSETTTQRIERDVVSARGDLEALEAERFRLLAEKARLEAMIAGEDAIALPEDLAEAEEIQPLVEAERRVKETDDRRLALQLAGLEDLKALLNAEIEALAQKEKTQERQLELAREEREKIGSLASEGLVVNTRISNLERTIADLESSILDIRTASLEARQEISKAEQDAGKFENDRTAELAIALQEAEAELEQNAAKARKQEALMREALELDPSAAAADEIVYRYEIRRGSGADEEVIPAEASTPVLPGDVVVVELVLPRTAY